jgi:dynein heavy chain
VKKEFASHYLKFMATVTEVASSAKGRTILYIPDEDIRDLDKAVANKELVHRLECSLILSSSSSNCYQHCLYTGPDR